MVLVVCSPNINNSFLISFGKTSSLWTYHSSINSMLKCFFSFLTSKRIYTNWRTKWNFTQIISWVIHLLIHRWRSLMKCIFSDLSIVPWHSTHVHDRIVDQNPREELSSRCICCLKVFELICSFWFLNVPLQKWIRTSFMFDLLVSQIFEDLTHKFWGIVFWVIL